MTGQFASVDEDLTGRENLYLFSRLFGLSRRDSRVRTRHLLDAFELEGAGDRQVKTYSGGMRRRLDIAAGIIITPDIIFLDEPTTGLDPRSRNQVWSIIRALVAGGTTVLLTTQYLEEADQLADRIAVIDHGRIIAEGTSSELKEQVGSGVLNIQLKESSDRDGAARLLSGAFEDPVEYTADQASLAIRISDPERASEVIAHLCREGVAVVGYSYGRPSLDEVFLALTGHEAETDLS